MPEEMSALDHLVLGREQLAREIVTVQREIDALQHDVDRKSGTLTEFDALISRLDTGHITTRPAAPVTAPPAVTPPRTPRTTAPRARRAPARAAGAQQPRSIRVHVLEMLGSENRDFGLAEIIDRIHAEGIQAHDDAVRSITIKLMKDGRVERVGRGQYRLARRGRSGSRPSAPVTPSFDDAPAPFGAFASATAPGETLTALPADDVAVEDVAVPDVAADDTAADRGATDDIAVDEVTLDQIAADEVVPDEVVPDEVAATDTAPVAAATGEAATSPDEPPAPGSAGYVPPLNLGQPWG